jgi:sulfur relay (sulfurtransferase) DsrF/TusC family protein
MTTSVNQPLLICRHPAWSSDMSACVEMALTAGVFEQRPILVLTDAAVTLLLPGQDGEAHGLKTLARQVPAFELYGIDQVYADAAALAAHGIDATALEHGVKPLPMGRLAELMATAASVLVF